MEKLNAMRLGSVLFIALAYVSLSKKFIDVVMVVTMVHYVMAAIYSKSQLGKGLSKPVVVTLLAVAGVILYKLQAPITIVFGIHYAFTEVYLAHGILPPQLKNKTKPLRITALAFNFCIYLAILRNDQYFPYLNAFAAPMLIAAALSGICYYWALFRAQFYLTTRQVMSISLVENMSLLLCALSFLMPLKLTLFVYIGYHVVFWSIYPVPGLLKKQALKSYLALNLSLLLAVYLVSPMASPIFSIEIWLKLFMVAGFIHITTSLALTKAQPGWITRIFNFNQDPPPTTPVVVQKSRI